MPISWGTDRALPCYSLNRQVSIPQQLTTRWLRVIAASALLCVLTACSGSGDNSRTGEDDGKTLAESPPATPILAVAFSIRQMHFSWNGVSGATHYRLYRNPGGASAFIQIDGDLSASSQGHDIALHQLTGSVERYFLEACNAAGCTASNELNSLGDVSQAIGCFKASGNAAADPFCMSVSFSSDGKTLAVGAQGESIGAASSGAVYIFTHQSRSWSQQAYVTASNPSAGDSFGNSVSLSSDGNTLAVGSYLEDNTATGINGDQGSIADNNSNRGAVYVFTHSSGNWSQQAYIKASSSHDNAYFGAAVSLNSDGNTLAVGATGERTGALDSGAVYVFTRTTGTWSQQALVKAPYIRAGARFGSSVAFNGNMLAVGASGEDSVATGVGGDKTGGASDYSGAVYFLVRSAGGVVATIPCEGLHSEAGASRGRILALSSNGNPLAMGAPGETGCATGIGDNQTDNNAIGAGAAFPY